MLERHKAFLRFFPCRAEKIPAIRYTPRACPGPGWGKRPIPSYPCGAIYSSLRGVYPLRPSAYGARLRRGLFGRPSGYLYSLRGESPLRLRLRGPPQAAGTAAAPPIRCLRRSARQRAQCGPPGRQGPEGPFCREAAFAANGGSSPPAGGDSLSANRAQGAGTVCLPKRQLFLSHGTTSRAYYPTYQGWRSWIRPSLRFPLHRARY